MNKIKKIRLDDFLVFQDILKKELILPYVIEGNIYINDQKATSVAQLVDMSVRITIKDTTKKYVGRGSLKLEEALNKFKVDVSDFVCVDFGASTGGFTDVLLQQGSKKVYAVETGRNVLDHKLRMNSKVVNLEGVSLFKLDIFKEKIDLSVVDLSFIPLSHSLKHISYITNNAPIIALLKPHYEAQDESLLRKGVVKDSITLKSILNNFKNWLFLNNFRLLEIIESPIKGGGGNIEYLVHIIIMQH